MKYTDEYTSLMYGASLSIALLLAIIPDIVSRFIFSRHVQDFNDESRIVIANKNITKLKSDEHLKYTDHFTFGKSIRLFLLSLNYALILFLKEQILNSVPSDFYQKISLANGMNIVFYSYSLITVANLLLTCLFCYCVFTTKVRKHHFVGYSIIVCCTLFSFFSIKDIKQHLDSLKNETYWMVLIVVCMILLQSIIPIARGWLMEYDFMSPYVILVCQGILPFIYTFIRIQIEDQWGNLVTFFFQGDSLKLALVYLNIIFYFFYWCFTSLTNREFSPTHVYISPGMAGIYCWLFQLVYIWFDTFDGSNVTEFLIFFFSYPIWCFGCLVYNELIILHFCGIGENTRKEIMMRLSEDHDDLSIDDGNMDRQTTNMNVNDDNINSEKSVGNQLLL